MRKLIIKCCTVKVGDKEPNGHPKIVPYRQMFLILMKWIGKLVMVNGSLTPFCSLSNHSLSSTLTVLSFFGLTNCRINYMIINKVYKKKYLPLNLRFWEKPLLIYGRLKQSFQLEKCYYWEACCMPRTFFWKTALKSVFVKMQQNWLYIVLGSPMQLCR